MPLSDRKGVFLDVDPTIVENNLQFMNNSEQDEIQKFLGNSSHNVPTKLIKPSPGFCVKTKEIGSDEKIFINICYTDVIPAPKDITERELQQLLEVEECTFKVPMSIGQIRTEKDKKGEDAKTIDIAINTKFFTKISNSSLFKNFFMSIAFHGLENKYSLICNDSKIILNNRKAFGTLQMHRIEMREMQEKIQNDGQEKRLIEEINAPIVETNNSSNNKEPEYVLYKKKGQNYLIGEFKLPDIISSNEVTLDVGEDRILLESKTKGYLLDIFVPYIVRQQNCSSVFEKTTKILTVTMPLVGG